MSRGLKVVTSVSIIMASLMIFATLVSFKLQGSVIPIGAIITTLLGCMLLLSAGLFASKSVKVGCYVYAVSAAFFFLYYVIHLIVRTSVFSNMPNSLYDTIRLVTGIGALPFLLSLIGTIVCYRELKKQVDTRLLNTDD
jgi:hypothetical protein